MRDRRYRSPVCRAALAAAALISALSPATADGPATGLKRHVALSLIGTPAMAPGFEAFDWVNPAAPKGGTLRVSEIGSFDSLNGFSIKGDAAAGSGLMFDSLMSSSPDEPSTEYCHVCEWVAYPDDYSYVTFGLRPEARFNDGTPVTPEDVVFSLDALKKANPQTAFYYKNVVKAEKTGEREVTFTFDSKGNRELPQIVGELAVLPMHFFTAKGPNGEARDITQTTLEPPLGSGPYRLKSFEPGRSLVYARVTDYWAKDLPVSRGLWNFDEIRFEYFREPTAAFEAFKAGAIDIWHENSATNWATRYDIDVVKKGLVRKEALPHSRVAGMQSFAFNLRRKQFQDRRVRQAFNLAFDFESANKSLFYGQYTRTSSYFDNSELKATGLPQGRELEILSELKADVPPEVFTTEWKNPVNATPEDLRNHMREAVKLLNDAGWTIKNGVLTNTAGEPLIVEFLLVNPQFERVVLPYIENLKRIGVKATLRNVDSSQYERRIKSFDFDIALQSVGQSHSPGNEQRSFFGSAAADQPGSRNLGGIKDKAVDAIIDRIVFAKDRADLVAATHALDRVLLWNAYCVPNWHLNADRVATWDIFGRPAKLPSQNPAGDGVIEESWWIDPAKQAAVTAARGQ